MLNSFAGDVCSTPVTNLVNSYTEYASGGLSEFSISNDDSDLSDTFEFSSISSSKPYYSPKDIVSIYSKRMQNCADTIGCSSGIIQVNQFCQLLNSWYQSRFTPVNAQRNPKFLFRANKIPEWIDLFMIAAGNALHHEMFPAFLSDMHSWIDDLNTPKDSAWALPYSVMQIKKSDNSCYSQEAIVLEKILKPSIYDQSFFWEQLNSIESVYSETFGIPKEDLKLNDMIHRCPKLTVTSSFDASKYGAVS